eukprot:tig00020592_g11692.t1
MFEDLLARFPDAGTLKRAVWTGGLAEVCSRMGRYEQAIEHAKRALVLLNHRSPTNRVTRWLKTTFMAGRLRLRRPPTVDTVPVEKLALPRGERSQAAIEVARLHSTLRFSALQLQEPSLFLYASLCNFSYSSENPVGPEWLAASAAEASNSLAYLYPHSRDLVLGYVRFAQQLATDYCYGGRFCQVLRDVSQSLMLVGDSELAAQTLDRLADYAARAGIQHASLKRLLYKLLGIQRDVLHASVWRFAAALRGAAAPELLTGLAARIEASLDKVRGGAGASLGVVRGGGALAGWRLRRGRPMGETRSRLEASLDKGGARPATFRPAARRGPAARDQELSDDYHTVMGHVTLAALALHQDRAEAALWRAEEFLESGIRFAGVTPHARVALHAFFAQAVARVVGLRLAAPVTGRTAVGAAAEAVRTAVADPNTQAAATERPAAARPRPRADLMVEACAVLFAAWLASAAPAARGHPAAPLLPHLVANHAAGGASRGHSFSRSAFPGQGYGPPSPAAASASGGSGAGAGAGESPPATAGPSSTSERLLGRRMSLHTSRAPSRGFGLPASMRHTPPHGGGGGGTPPGIFERRASFRYPLDRRASTERDHPPGPGSDPGSPSVLNRGAATPRTAGPGAAEGYAELVRLLESASRLLHRLRAFEAARGAAEVVEGLVLSVHGDVKRARSKFLAAAAHGGYAAGQEGTPRRPRDCGYGLLLAAAHSLGGGGERLAPYVDERAGAGAATSLGPGDEEGTREASPVAPPGASSSSRPPSAPSASAASASAPAAPAASPAALLAAAERCFAANGDAFHARAARALRARLR